MHPRLFQFGHFILPTYGALIALGLIVSLLVCMRVARLLSLDADKVFNLALLAIAVTLAGAKILLAVVNWPRLGMRALGLSLVNANEALFAGIGVAIVLCWIYARRVRLPVRRTADALAPALAVGDSLASIACLEAGCSYGALTHAPWAIVYTSPFVTPGTPIGVPLHPTQIYSGLMDFVLFVALLWLLRRPHADGEIMGAWLYLRGLGGFFLAFLRGGYSDRLLGGLLSTTQFIATAMVLCGGYLWLRHAAGSRAPYAG